MGKMELTAKYIDRIEGDHKEADVILKDRIPRHLDGLKLRLSYLDEKRQEHATIVTINGQDVISEKE